MLLAEYRFCYKKGKLGHAKNHAAYILREENYTSRKEELVYKESGNMEMFDGTSAVKFGNMLILMRELILLYIEK